MPADPAHPRTLIFPAGMPAATAFKARAEDRGTPLVGASSIADDPAQAGFDAWETLPFVTDAGFDGALQTVLHRRRIAAIYTPHYVVAAHLARRLPAIAPGVDLVAEPGPADTHAAYRRLEQRVAALPHLPGAPGRPPLSDVQRTGLIRLAATIPGMCGEPKMAALIDALARAPRGDVVEIGSWWGRSAAILVWLARHYRIGPVLCIDPWDPADMHQGDPLLDSLAPTLEPEHALRMFEINLAPLAEGGLNYLRARSAAAAALYRPAFVVETPAFGATRYGGRIAVLHIDGNHAPAIAAQDIALWGPHLLPGGWVIFDDYEWAFGDGPRRAADAFVARQAGRVAMAVQAGPALFVQLRGAPHG